MADEEMMAEAERLMDGLIENGDPFCGDDWSLVRILRRFKSALSESELYRRGYDLIGACDISNYLARCAEGGRVLEG